MRGFAQPPASRILSNTNTVVPRLRDGLSIPTPTGIASEAKFMIPSPFSCPNAPWVTPIQSLHSDLSFPLIAGNRNGPLGFVFYDTSSDFDVTQLVLFVRFPTRLDDCVKRSGVRVTAFLGV